MFVLPSEYCCLHDNCTQCRSLDGLSLYWPVESRAVTITSYMKERFEKQSVCDQPTYDYANQHTSFQHVWERDFYTVHPENALIKVEHSITADGGGFSGSHRKMDGRLVDAKGKTLKKMKANAVNKIYLNDFLKAAGLNLSDISDAVNADGRTYRRMGIVLHVLLDYRNSDAYWFGVGHTSYTYRVQHVPLTDYRVKQEIPVVSANGSACQRIVNKRFGPRLEFHQVGKIGQYSMGNLLMQLVSFMGLLTLTATIVDVFALYLVPAKETYRRYVYDEPEFEGDREGEKPDNTKEKEE